MVPKRLPAGLVIASARTFTRDYQETVAMWTEAGVPVWGTVPERVGDRGRARRLALGRGTRHLRRRLAPPPARPPAPRQTRRVHGTTLDGMDVGPVELLIVLAVVLLLFGSKKLPELAKGMGQAAKEFRCGLHDESDEQPGAPAVTAAPTERAPASSS